MSSDTLTAVTIENFRCLRHVKVPIRPLTVLVGPNDSGKSAFVAALQFLGGGVGCQDGDWWRDKRGLPITVVGSCGNRTVVAKASDGRIDVVPGGSNPLQEQVKYYQLPSTGVRMTSQGWPDAKAPFSLASDGGDVAALLDHVQRVDRPRFDSIAEAMRELVPGMEKIIVATPDPPTRRVDFVIEDGYRFPADKASVGVRLLMFFVALAYHPSPPNLILVEEPENGVHPRRLRDVMRLLHAVTSGDHGDHPSQVVVTTHSPYLLDNVDLKSDQVLVFRRNDDGSRTCEPADAERLKNFLDEFMLGEVWYNEGEEGLVARKS